MTFKTNLLKKIKIDKLSTTVLNSLGSPESEKKLDKSAMRQLLEIAGYQVQNVRDLELYCAADTSIPEKILVLDNELAIYDTTIDDVAMRKSPTVKEMVSIRNAIKILNDKDVVISKKDVSIRSIQRKCLDTLDLRYRREDIEQIENDGSGALATGYSDGVIEALELFSELLGYRKLPKSFAIDHFKMLGKSGKTETDETVYGPIVLYSLAHNELKLIENPISPRDRKQLDRLHNIAQGKENADRENDAVFDFLRDQVLADRPD